ncbi:MAG: redoxin domain-containing protein [Ignavibacteria bacterium]|jgi:thiol-disulfide isomerase/thioredoxin
MNIKIGQMFFFIMLLFSFGCEQDGNDNFTFSPKQPKPGETITIKFRSYNTDLQNKEVSYIIFSVKNGILNAEEYPLQKKGSEWEGEYKIPDSSHALGLKFIDVHSSFREQVKQTTFPIQLYEQDAKPLKGTKAGLAFIVGYNGVINEKGDIKKTYKLYKEEFEVHPDLIKYYLYQYSNAINSIEGNTEGILKSTLNQFDNKKEFLTEDQLLAISKAYLQFLKDEEKSSEYLDFVKAKYPEGIVADDGFTQKFYNERNDIKKKEELFCTYLLKHSNPEGLSFASMIGQIITGYCNQGKYKEAKAFLTKIKFNPEENKWGWLSGFLAQAASFCLNKEANKEYVEYFNDLSLKTAKTFFDMPKPNPYRLTKNQFENMKKEFASDIIYSTAAKVYEKYKSSQEALAMAEKGYNRNSSSGMKEIYSRLLVKNNRADEALKITDEAITDGKTSETILAVHKSAYKKVNGSDEGYNTHLAKLKDKFIAKYLEEVKASLINDPAPAFTLTDLDGKEISLTDYKGKTVILDFWATWCSPCKASFPAMKKAVEKYSNNSDVVFLFMNTMERTGKQGENASKLMKANGYPFHVLLDTGSKAAALYEVSSIPTKIFIDKNGNIRYKSVGFEGEDMLLKEIDTIIELTK